METKSDVIKMICVTCPRGCGMTVHRGADGGIQVSGNFCPRGVKYANTELTDPRRMIASTVRVRNGVHAVLPVATDAPLPKGLIFELTRILKDVIVDAPIKMGEVVLGDVAGSGVNIRASRDLAERAR